MDLYSEESCDVHFLAVLSKFRIAKLYGRGLGMDDNSNKVYGKWGLPVFTRFRNFLTSVAAATSVQSPAVAETSEPELHSYFTPLPAFSKVKDRITDPPYMQAKAPRVERREMIPGGEIVTFHDDLKMSSAFTEMINHPLQTSGVRNPPEIMHLFLCNVKCKSAVGVTRFPGVKSMEESFRVMAQTLYDLLKNEPGLAGGSIVVDQRLYPRADLSQYVETHVDNPRHVGIYPPGLIPPRHYNKIMLLYNESVPEHGTYIATETESATYPGSGRKNIAALLMDGNMPHAQRPHTTPIPEGQVLIHSGVSRLIDYMEASTLQQLVLSEDEEVQAFHQKFEEDVLAEWRRMKYALVVYIAWDKPQGETTRLKMNIVPIQWRREGAGFGDDTSATHQRTYKRGAGFGDDTSATHPRTYEQFMKYIAGATKTELIAAVKSAKDDIPHWINQLRRYSRRQSKQRGRVGV